MRSTDTKWQWIDFLGRDITAGTSGRRVLLGWIGSASVAVAIVLWSLLTLLEQLPSSSVGVSLLGLALTGFLAARAVTALYPGGFAGLVDEILGIESDADIGLSPLVDFMFANLALVRSRLFMLALADLIPILLLALIAASPAVLPGGALSVIQLLVLVRLVIFLFYLFIMIFFFSKPLLVRSSAQRTDQVMNLVERNPRLARIVLKFAILERFGSVSINMLFYGVQLLLAAWIVTTLAGSVFLTARLLLLATVAAILSRVSWELWGRTKDLALQISFIADLQRDLLGDQVKVEEMAREYEETLKDIRVDLAAPYVIPASVWKARGETPPGD